jgi:ankyrin repeat protein
MASILSNLAMLQMMIEARKNMAADPVSDDDDNKDQVPDKDDKGVYDMSKIPRMADSKSLQRADALPRFDLYTMAVSKPALPRAIIAGHIKSHPDQVHLKHGKWERTALHSACKHDNLGAVEAMLAAGADPVALDLGQNTPLLLAVRSGNKSIIMRLLQESAVRHAINTPRLADQATPLWVAAVAIARTKDVTIMNMLLQQDEIDPNTLLKSGGALLHYLAREGKTLALTVMLTHPLVDVNKLHSVLQCTPIHLAVSAGNFKVASLLLSHRRINPLLRDAQQRTARDLIQLWPNFLKKAAHASGEKDVLDMLTLAESKVPLPPHGTGLPSIKI